MTGTSRTPVLDLGGLLLLTVRGELEDDEAVDLQADVTEAVSRTGSRGLIIDISALEIVDSFLARVLVEVALASRLLAARTVLVGMRPAVAITLVELGLALEGMTTARTVTDAAAGFGVTITASGAEGRVGP